MSKVIIDRELINEDISIGYIFVVFRLTYRVTSRCSKTNKIEESIVRQNKVEIREYIYTGIECIGYFGIPLIISIFITYLVLNS